MFVEKETNIGFLVDRMNFHKINIAECPQTFLHVMAAETKEALCQMCHISCCSYVKTFYMRKQVKSKVVILGAIKPICFVSERILSVQIGISI